MSSLFARRLRTISTTSLPSDFCFSSPSTSDSKSSTVSLPSLASNGMPVLPQRRQRKPLGAFLPLLPLQDSLGGLDESPSPASSTGSDRSSSPGTEEEEDPEANNDPEDGDSDRAFSDISEPTTPSSEISDPLDVEVENVDVAMSNDFFLSPSHLKSLQHLSFSLLSPSDHPYLLTTSTLLTLRDTNPALCAAKAMELISDPLAPRCWRSRAGVYRAEGLWKLGLEEEAKRELGYAERALMEGGGEAEDEGHKLQEALVAWNIHTGKMNWGMYDEVAASADEVQGLGIDLEGPADVIALDLSI